MKFLILIVCIVSCCLIELNQAQQTICSALETSIDYKGNDMTFTYDAKTPQGKILKLIILFNIKNNIEANYNKIKIVQKFVRFCIKHVLVLHFGILL